LPVPDGARVNRESTLADIVPMPVIIKPDKTLCGKSNIYFCSDSSHMAHYINNAVNASNNQFAEIESYIEGIDSTCLFLLNNGNMEIIAWWDELVGIDINKNITGLGVSVPSVIENTGAQEKAEDILSKLASFFPEVKAVLLVSFRISLKEEVYIIEIHADLGGDLIAELLLPAAIPGFDFFQETIKILTGEVTIIKRIKFPSTSLYYLSEIRKKYKNLYTNYHAYVISHWKNIRENLSILDYIIRYENINLFVKPLHKLYLEEIIGKI